jgi:hypothetical protein
MSGIASALIAWLGPDMAVAVIAAALAAGFCFVVYGCTRLVLWLVMGAWRALERLKRAGLRHEPGKPAAGGADRV